MSERSASSSSSSVVVVVTVVTRSKARALALLFAVFVAFVARTGDECRLVSRVIAA
jgi:hypothetical protein